jgi:uncharacterized protein (TIGR04255 family)
MSESKHYKNAPITEAIVSIKVVQRADFSFPLLESIFREDLEKYPIRSELFRAHGEIKFGDGVTSLAEKEPQGYHYSNIEKNYILQCMIDGFALSRLAPYENWTAFSEEAKQLWETYNASLNPIAIKQLSVRYINKINVPAENFKLPTYFRTYPELSSELPQELHGFFLQLQAPLPRLDAQININQAIVTPDSDEVVSIVLDIDLASALSKSYQEEDIWNRFSELHDEKNRIFEACITDETRRLFN